MLIRYRSGEAPASKSQQDLPVAELQWAKVNKICLRRNSSGQKLARFARGGVPPNKSWPDLSVGELKLLKSRNI